MFIRINTIFIYANGEHKDYIEIVEILINTSRL